jgi:uncharacterized protein YndB with AHSA1/START domain
MHVEGEIVLPAPPERAWAVLVDWERQARWMRDADRVDVVSRQREGVGTTVAVRTRVLGVPLFTERLEVVTWDPPRQMRMAHRSFVRGVGTWSLEAAGTGSRFRWQEDLSLPVPLLGETALLAYRPFMRRLMRGAMRDLHTCVGDLPDPNGR